MLKIHKLGEDCQNKSYENGLKEAGAGDSYNFFASRARNIQKSTKSLLPQRMKHTAVAIIQGTNRQITSITESSLGHQNVGRMQIGNKSTSCRSVAEDFRFPESIYRLLRYKYGVNNAHKVRIGW
eukprot:741879_1